MSEVEALHRRICVADAHADSLMWNRDLTVRSDQGHVDFERLRTAGVKLQCFTVVTRGFPYLGSFPLFARYCRWPAAARRSEWSRALWQIEQLHRFCERSKGQVAVTTQRRQLEENVPRGVLSAVLGIEGGHAIEGEISRVEELFRRGVRFMGPVHLSNNQLGGSSFPLMLRRGLTSFGRDVLDEMARVGMAVDVAHASVDTLEDILSHQGTRPFCSHTGLAAVADKWRNLSDASARRIADRGGVIGVIFGTVYLGGREIADVVRHIEHALQVAGEDSVALGSDFDGMVPLPRGMRDVRDLGLITEALLRLHPPRRVEKVLGENLKRFLLEILV